MQYSTLCFAKRWLEKLDFPSYVLPLRDLVQGGIINAYPPLVDTEGSFVAQWEHTLILRPTCKEVLSRGEDY
jgi:methionyl aminopeptidase